MNTISVALCTYNGGLFLEEQIKSIIKQTRLPDQLIICDDCSNDNTISIISNFINTAPFPIKLFINKNNIGSTKNFEQCIKLCEGDIIVLSDQDDVWLPNKLTKIEQAIRINSHAGYVFSDARVVGEKLQPLGYTIWESVGFSIKMQKKFEYGRDIDVLLNHNIVTGATMALKSSIVKQVLPISKSWIHDGWIALVAAIIGKGGVMIREPLILYRQHQHQQIGGVKYGIMDRAKYALKNREKFIIDMEQCEKMYIQVKRYIEQRIASGIASGKESIALSKVNNKILHIQKRKEITSYPLWKRPSKIISELLTGRYHLYSNSWVSIARDAIL